MPFFVEFRVGLGDHELRLFDRREIFDVCRRLAIHDLAVGRLEEAVLVGPRINREGVDQTDVRAFRRFNRAHTAVMGRVNVAHLETGTLAREAARTEGRNTPLVGNFRQRVVLIHELR